MGKYVDIYHYSKKNLDGIKKKLKDYLDELNNMKLLYPDDLSLLEFVNSQSVIINKIREEINEYISDIKSESYNLDNGK